MSALDPHVTGACVIILDEDAATALFEVLQTEHLLPQGEHPPGVLKARCGELLTTSVTQYDQPLHYPA